MGHLDFYQITRAAGEIETLLGVAAHTRFDPPIRQPSLPLSASDPGLYTQKIPRDQLVEFLALAQNLYVAGAREPKDFAAKLQRIDDGKLKPYSTALWCGLRACYPNLPDVNDWETIYRDIDG